MVAVRSTGLTLDSVIGRLDTDGEGISIVPGTYLEGLLAVANERFEENSRRIARFHDLLLGSTAIPTDVESGKKTRGSDWEDASVRRERKRAEGLQEKSRVEGCG
jgi:tRNA wybutosine-synthesizing protein 3